MINPHISFKPYSLRKGNNHFVKRQMYALKQANSRLSNQRERERVKTPGKVRSVKRNSMKYRRRKYDLYDNINSCITFQAASTRDDINSYHNEIRDSGNSHIQNFKKFNIFENIAVPDAKFDIFRGTPDSTATKGYNVNGFKEFDLIMNNKFNSALKKSITNEQFKRRHMIKHNQEITSLKKLHDERNRKAINSKGQSQNPPQINSRSLIAKKSCNKKVIVPWSRTSQNQKNISCDVEIKRERPSGFKMKIKKENCYDSLSKNSLNQTKLYHCDPNSKMNIVENEQSEQKTGSRKNTDGSEYPEADREKSTSAGGNKVKLDLRDLADVKDTNGAFPEKRFNEEGSWDQDKKFIEIYKQHLKESKVISSSRTDLRIQEKTNEYDSNYVKTSYGIKFLDTKETSDLLLTNSSNKNLSAREFIKQKSHKSHDSAVKAVGLPQIMSTSPYRKKNTKIDKAHHSAIFMNTIGMSKNPDLTLKHNENSPEAEELELQRCTSEKKIKDHLRLDWASKEGKIKKSELLNLSKNCIVKKRDQLLTEEEKLKLSGIKDLKARKLKGRIHANKNIRRKTTLKPKKEPSRLADYDPQKKEKKPRVPKTKRPRARVERRNTITTKPLPKQECTYDPCTITIYKQDYTHLDDCLINQVLRDYNSFVKLTFKNKSGYDLGNIKHYAKRFGIAINQKMIQEEDGFKDKAI